jgi:hypothetical protein
MNKLARWRGRVDEAFRERSELHPSIVQEIDSLNQLQEGATQPVQFPHDDDVAFASAVKHSEKLWPICFRTRGLLLVNTFSAGSSQSVDLQVRLLLVGRDAGVTD